MRRSTLHLGNLNHEQLNWKYPRISLQKSNYIWCAVMNFQRTTPRHTIAFEKRGRAKHVVPKISDQKQQDYPAIIQLLTL